MRNPLRPLFARPPLPEGEARGTRPASWGSDGPSPSSLRSATSPRGRGKGEHARRLGVQIGYRLPPKARGKGDGISNDSKQKTVPGSKGSIGSPCRATIRVRRSNLDTYTYKVPSEPMSDGLRSIRRQQSGAGSACRCRAFRVLIGWAHASTRQYRNRGVVISRSKA